MNDLEFAVRMEEYFSKRMTNKKDKKRMTKDEIISGLKFTVDMFLFDPDTGEKLTEPRNDLDKTTIDACKGAIELLEYRGRMKNLNDIRAYLVENVFRNPVAMFSDDRDLIDLPEIIASLYECLHILITGEPYEYMFHWANKVGSDVDDQLFIEDK